MSSDPEQGKRYAFGIASTLAWLTLLVAFVATTATMTIDNLKHVGNSASTIVQHLSNKPATVSSLIEEFQKDADTKTSAEIDKNRATIEKTIASLGGDKAFQDSLAKTLNKISEAIFNGSKNVTVDFGPLAAAVADRVNAASKSPVINKEDLAKIKPKILDLSNGSTNISDARNRIKEVTLAWLLWFVLLGVLYLLRQWKFLRTAGWQLFSVGSIFLGAHFAAPVLVHNAINNSDISGFQKDLLPEILKSLTRPMMVLAVIVLVAGVVLLVIEQLVRNHLLSKAPQISPSVVA